MDPITTAILTAHDAGIVKTTRADQQAALEVYRKLKTTLHQKFGAGSDLADALEKLEAKPDSSGRRELLKEEVVAAGADGDARLLKLARTLLARIEAEGEDASPTWPLPLQRPGRVHYFTGRETELAQLLIRLQAGRVVALTGPAGVGKSALVAEALWQLAPGETPPPAFPAGLIYHSFYIQPRVDIALEYIAQLFGEEPTPTSYDAAQRALAERQALLVLHGAEQADDLPGLLAIRGRCGVLVTGRDGPEAITERQQVGPLPLDQAVTLLQAWGGVLAGGKAAKRLCELVGGLPLAVRLAGQYLATRAEQPAEYLAWLETTTLPGLDQAQRLQASVPLLLEHTLARVSKTARQALAVVGLLAPLPFEQEVVIEALAIEPDQGLLSAMRKIFKQKLPEEMPNFSQALAELAHYGLLQQRGQHYEISHTLIHAYAREHLTAPTKTIRRLAATYVALAWEQSILGSEGHARLDAHRPHIMRILAECLQWEDWEAAYGLAAAVEDYLDRQDYWAERVIANEIGLIAAWQLGRPNEGAWLSNLGDTFRTMGQAKWAIRHFEKALVTARQTGDQHSVGNSLGNLGLAYRDLGQIEPARQYLQQALTIFEEIRSPSAKYVREWLAELEAE